MLSRPRRICDGAEADRGCQNRDVPSAASNTFRSGRRADQATPHRYGTPASPAELALIGNVGCSIFLDASLQGAELPPVGSRELLRSQLPFSPASNVAACRRFVTTICLCAEDAHWVCRSWERAHDGQLEHPNGVG